MKHTKAGREQNTIRRNSAKRSAERLNSLVIEIRKTAGVEFTRDQLAKLAGLFSHYETLNEQADRTWEIYSDHCEKWDYEQEDIEYLV